MFRHLFFILIFLITLKISAQKEFIKTLDDAGFGSSLRVLPTTDQGWVIFSLDSAKLTKFNHCGIIQWTKKYKIPTVNYHSDFILSQNGGFAILSSSNENGKSTSVITTLDGLGNLLWSKSFGSLNTYDHFPYTLNLDAQDNFVLYGNLQGGTNSYNMISKIDGSGTIIWTKQYDLGGIWGGAIVTSDGGILVRTGNRFIKMDNGGNVQWTSSILSNSCYYYLAPIEVVDGYIFTSYKTASANNVFYKITKQGNLSWTDRKEFDYTGMPPLLKKKSNGNIVAIFKKPVSVSGTNYPTVIEFDKDLNVIHENTFNVSQAIQFPQRYSSDMCFLSDETPIITGICGGTSFPFYIKATKTYQTNCDMLSPAINFSLTPVTQLFITTNSASINLNVIDKLVTVTSFSPSQTTLCSKPKFLTLGNDTTLCQGETLTLKNKTNDLFDDYNWSIGAATSTISISKSGTYWLSVKDECTIVPSTDTVKVLIKQATIANLGDDITKCENVPFVLKANTCSDCSYEWNTGNNRNEIEINEDGMYWLKINNANECSSSDTIKITNAKCECDFYVPNSFTPNFDGLNDAFKSFYYCDLYDYSMKIFDRWGVLIYETNDRDAVWDGSYKGSLVKQDIYTYLIKYTPIIKGKRNSSITKNGIVAVIY